MVGKHEQALIRTVKERCRVCFTCVRECPAKAIRILAGQAEVVAERCIGCGNCVSICSQGAKVYLDTTSEVLALLASDEPVAAVLAPSFPVEFPRLGSGKLVGALRTLGFERVAEVAFGADLVAAAYRRLLAEHPGERFIATTCPAVVGYVQRYHPRLVGSLAPIVSPMVAEARALRRRYGDGLRVVFVGPCVAKKSEESEGGAAATELDAVITFQELRTLLSDASVDPEAAPQSEFDRPHAELGALFPISKGILQAADLQEDLLSGDVVAADGRHSFAEAVREFETGDLDARLLETLCCNGCIMGPGLTTDAPLFRRRAWVSQHARRRMAALDREAAAADRAELADLDLGRRFAHDDQRRPAPSQQEIATVLARMGKVAPEDELDCGACGYDTCREHAEAILEGLAEVEMCLPFSIAELKRTVGELASSNEQLATTQQALLHSEKLASMGQLAAGIAHEVNNPLGVVLMYSHLLRDEVDPSSRLHADLQLIAEQADRCKRIVAGLLGFARQSRVVLQNTDLRRLVDRTAAVLPPPQGVQLRVEHQPGDSHAEVDEGQLTQVLTNLITNAYAAMPCGGRLTLLTGGTAERVTLQVRDTGVGIPPEHRSKVFEPFFTTKQLGEGTGLGLAVTYGIVKMHRGQIEVVSQNDPAAGPTGTTFTVTLPRRAAASQGNVA